MKTDKLRTFLLAWFLGLAGAFGSLGCLTTGFGLRLAHGSAIGLILLVWGLFCCGCFLLRWGKAAVLCALGLFTGYFFYSFSGRNETVSLILSVLERFDSAYHWGVPALSVVRQSAADWPMALLGLWVQTAVCRAVCGRHGTTEAVSLLVMSVLVCLVVTDTLPSALPLGALLLTAGTLVLTDTVRQDSVSQANRLLAMSLLPGILCLGLLFALLPQGSFVNRAEEMQDKLYQLAQRLPEQLQNQQLRVPQRSVASVDLAALKGQPKLGIPVLEVTSERGGPLYLREQDYDSYTGRGWKASSWRQEVFGGSGEAVDRITIHTQSISDVLLLPYYPQWGTLLTDGRLENTAHAADYSAEVFAPAAYPAPEDRFLALPAETARRAGELLARLPGSFATAEAAAATVADYVRQSAAYDRNTGAMPRGAEDFAFWFLEESDTGYCVHFATAATVLLRSLGIPARYVTGYRVDTLPGETVTVTTDDGHAWTEYFDAAASTWKRLDATPAEEDGPGPEASTEPAVPRETTPSRTEPTKAPVPASPEPSREDPGLVRAAGMLLVCFLTGSVLWLQRSLRVQLRRRRQQTGPVRQQVSALWQEAEAMARRLGEKPPEELRETLEKAWYSPHVLSREELAAFGNYCRTARRRLMERPLWHRLVDQYLYCLY